MNSMPANQWDVGMRVVGEAVSEEDERVEMVVGEEERTQSSSEIKRCHHVVVAWIMQT